MTAGTLTSPNYISKSTQNYDHNLNCTWILNADQEFYITLEIDSFGVNNDTISFISTTFYVNFLLLAWSW